MYLSNRGFKFLEINWDRESTVPEGEVDSSKSLRILFKRLLYGSLVIMAVTLVLTSFGVNVTILLVVLVIGVITLFLVAQDTLTDMVYGFIVLFDRPFRIGDRIEIQGLGAWGDIVNVGAHNPHPHQGQSPGDNAQFIDREKPGDRLFVS